MADPTEQTVIEAVYERFPYSMPLPRETIAVLGIDPDMPVSRLAADLAIAARARACTKLSAMPWHKMSPDDLVAYLLNGEQPHV